MATPGRNQEGLDQDLISYCVQIWELLCGDNLRPLDTSQAHQYNSQTRFSETYQIVFLGANVCPGNGLTATARMSEMACLAHELAHFERFEMGYNRPIEHPDSLRDEAETSIHASFKTVLPKKDRDDLIEDAQDRLNQWLLQKDLII